MNFKASIAAQPQAMDIQDEAAVPNTLVPILCLILAMVILILCLVGFCLFCLSAFITRDCSHSEDLEIATNDDQTPEDKVPMVVSEGCEGDKSFGHHSGSVGQDLAIKLAENDSHSVIINMDPPSSDKSGCWTRSMLQRNFDLVSLEDVRNQTTEDRTVTISGKPGHVERTEGPSQRRCEEAQNLSLMLEQRHASMDYSHWPRASTEQEALDQGLLPVMLNRDSNIMEVAVRG